MSTVSRSVHKVPRIVSDSEWRPASLENVTRVDWLFLFFGFNIKASNNGQKEGAYMKVLPRRCKSQAEMLSDDDTMNNKRNEWWTAKKKKRLYIGQSHVPRGNATHYKVIRHTTR